MRRHRSPVMRGAALLALAGIASLQGPAFAQQSQPARASATVRDLMGTLRNARSGSEEARIGFDSSGYLRHLGAPPGAAFQVSGSGPEGTARAFLTSCDGLLGIADPLFDFAPNRTRSTSGGRSAVRLQQTFGGIPVFGAMASVQLDASSGVEYLLADLAHDLGGLRRALERAGSVRSAHTLSRRRPAPHRPHLRRLRLEARCSFRLLKAEGTSDLPPLQEPPLAPRGGHGMARAVCSWA